MEKIKGNPNIKTMHGKAGANTKIIPRRDYSGLTVQEIIAVAREHNIILKKANGQTRIRKQILLDELHDKLKETGQLDLDTIGLLPAWVKFIDNYFENGFNATRAYASAYPNAKSWDAIMKNAARLLKKQAVKNEIRYRLNANRVTDSYVLNGLTEVIEVCSSEQSATAKVSALEKIAKIRGMMIDVTRHEFNKENPAIFIAAVGDKEKEKIEKRGRIME